PGLPRRLREPGARLFRLAGGPEAPVAARRRHPRSRLRLWHSSGSRARPALSRHWRRYLSGPDCPGAPARAAGDVSLRRHGDPAVSSTYIRRGRVVLCAYSSARARTSALVGALPYLVATWWLSDGHCRASGVDGLQRRLVRRPNVLESC